MHRLVPHVARRRRPPEPFKWPSFRGIPTLIGTSPSGKVAIYLAQNLVAHPKAAQNAKDLLAAADGVVSGNDAIFGTVGGPVQVILFALSGATDGTGGADHGGCDYQTGAAIEVDISLDNSERCVALFEAELSECSMGGDLCGYSNGEALSRWCAMVLGKNALADFVSAPSWIQAGMPDWVNNVKPTDQDYPSIGCGMAFISWLRSLGHDLNKIAPVMVNLTATGPFSQVYAQLTGDTAGNAWPTFQTAVKALSGVTTDDPFNTLAAVS